MFDNVDIYSDYVQSIEDSIKNAMSEVKKIFEVLGDKMHK